MPLFHVQDSDRPGWVIAQNYGHAVQKWQVAVRAENDGDDLEPLLPDGVQFVADDSNIIATNGWIVPI